jgi:hypothetical protein
MGHCLSVDEPFGTSDRLALCRKLLTLERNELNKSILTPSANVTAQASRANVHRTTRLKDAYC